MSETTGLEKIPRGLQAAWGVGALGTATLLYVNAFLLLYFLTSELGMAPALAGAIIFGSKVYDALIDPLVGMLSDRSQSSAGRRRPWMFAGALVCGASGVMIFNVPEFAGATALVAYVIIVLLVYATGYTMFNVPYLAMPAEMTDGYHERTRLMSWRVGFVALGGIVGTSLAPLIVAGAGGGRPGYGVMGWAMGAVIGSAMLLSVLGTARARFTYQQPMQLALAERLRLVWQNRPFCLLMGAKLLQLVGLSSVLASLPFFVLGVMQRTEAWLAIFGITLNLGTILAMPAWVWLSKRYGKKVAYMISVVLYAGVLLTWAVAGPDEALVVFAARAALVGLTSGGILLMGTALLPDTMEYDYQRTGLRREGIYSGVYSLVEKSAFAVAPLAVGTILSLTGYVEPGGAAVDDPAAAGGGVYLSLIAIPACAGLLSLVFLYPYRLAEEDLGLAREVRES